MNWIIILGIIFIALGSYLTYFGANINSAKIKKEVVSKIEQTENSIKEAMHSQTIDKEAYNKLLTLDNDFENWAQDIIKGKELAIKKELLKRQNEEVSDLTERLGRSKVVLPYFETFIQDITSAFHSLRKYDKSTHLKLISVELPSDLFYDPKNPTIFQIILTSKSTMYLYFASDFNGTYVEYPKLYFKKAGNNFNEFKSSISPAESEAVCSNLMIDFEKNIFEFKAHERYNEGYGNLLKTLSAQGDLKDFHTFSQNFSKSFLEKLLIRSEIEK